MAPSLDKLASLICDFLENSQRPALFAGAGVSVHAGLPSWSEFIDHLARVAEQYQPLASALIMDRLTKGHILSAATTYKTCPEIPVGERLRQMALPFTAAPQANRLNPLVSLPFSAIFTTNYDRSLLDAYASVHSRAPLQVELGDQSMRQAPYFAEPFIARLHGRAELAETMIVDEADYARTRADADYLDCLRVALTQFACLFIGYSFADPAISHVLDLIAERFAPSFPGFHTALIPMDAPADIENRLANFNIRVVRYPQANGHQALWDAITDCARETSARPTPVQLPSSILVNIQRFLGTSYARFRLGHDIGPLRDMVIDGIVTRFLQDAGQSGLPASRVTELLSAHLGLPIREVLPISQKSLRSLTSKGIVELKGEAFSLPQVLPDYLDKDLATLAKAILSRARLREGVTVPSDFTPALKSTIEATLIARGWDLGAYFAGSDAISDPPDVLNTALAALETRATHLDRSSREAIGRSMNDLFQRPDEEESTLLSELGRLAFALQVVSTSPAANLVHSAILPEIIYLDASVLMPALLEGHPYHPVYVDAMTRLAEASRAIGQPITIKVGREFLNEVISHRELAIQEVRTLRLDNPDELEKFILFYGAESTNVFVAAYATWVGRRKARLSFDQFLHDRAPYSTVPQLASHVESEGLEVISLASSTEIDKSPLTDVRYHLRVAYDADESSEFRRKPDILIDHEVFQLAQLELDRLAGLTSFFVSADLRLRRLASGPRLSPLGHSILSHRALVQLVDLLFGFSSDPESVSRLLWSRPRTDADILLRDFFISRALKSYDEAQILAIPNVLDRIVEEARTSAKEEQVVLFPDASPDKKTQAAAFLDRFEKRFFDDMAEAISKQS